MHLCGGGGGGGVCFGCGCGGGGGDGFAMMQPDRCDWWCRRHSHWCGDGGSSDGWATFELYTDTDGQNIKTREN